MLLEQLSAPVKKALAVNSILSAYPTKTTTRTRPTGNGVIDLGFGCNRKKIRVMPYGLGVSNDTMSFWVIGWEIIDPDMNSVVYVPTTLAKFTATLGTTTGIAGGAVLATELFADTIALVTGTNADFADVNSPVDDTVAFAEVVTLGCPILEIVPIIGTTPTSVNALYRMY